jgi:hypothetical protein
VAVAVPVKACGHGANWACLALVSLPGVCARATAYEPGQVQVAEPSGVDGAPRRAWGVH